MKKISINKKDLVPHIVEKILESEDDEILLVIPQDSEIKKSLSNFYLIKREAETAGKTVYVDSSDPEVIEMYEKAGVEIASSSNEGGDSRVMSDIVPSEHIKYGKQAKGKVRTFKLSKEIEEEEISEEIKSGESFWAKAEEESMNKKQFRIPEEIDELPQPEKRKWFGFIPSFRRTSSIVNVPKDKQEGERHKKKIHWHFGGKGKRVVILVFALVLFVVGAGWAVGAIWGRAEVSLSFKKTTWQYSGKITANKAFSKIDTVKGHLPAELFKQEKNVTRLFPASGTAQVSQKATAKILIYNAYSSSKQTLVASTRFSTPDGKIFRLNNTVVPGAGIKDGKIVPSSVETLITADMPGTDYNIGPFGKMTIPGFKNTPRYDGFYGAMPKQASGGFIGQKKVATDKDIVSAKDKTTQELKGALQVGFLNSRPQGFNVLDGASSVVITKMSVNKNTDADGNFSVFGEASFRALGFRDDDLKSFAEALMLKDFPIMKFIELKLDEQNIAADFVAGQVAFSISANGVLEPEFSGDELKPKIAGKPVNEARTLLIKLPELANAKISLWPFWLNDLPSNSYKIKVIWD